MDLRFLRTLFVTLIGVGFLATSTHGASEGPRKVTLRWKEVEGALRYQVQVSRNADMDPTLYDKEIPKLSARMGLPPGTYYFRVRGIDAKDTPGPWSSLEGFIVNPHPPRLLGPRPRSSFRKLPSEEGLRLQWKRGITGTEHVLEIRDAQGVALERKVDGGEFQWVPPHGGIYKWRVGFEGPDGGMEWSPYGSFRIEEEALAAVVPPVNGADRERLEKLEEAQEQWKEEKTRLQKQLQKKGGVKTEPPLVTEYGSFHDEDSDTFLNRAQPWQFVGYLRFGQSVVAYTGEDQDLGVSTSGAALVALGSAELRWRAAKPAGTPWLISGSLNVEVIRESILTESFLLPRFYTRVFATNGRGRWRGGPFLHFQYGKGAVFIVQGQTQARTAEVGRISPGAGGVIVYQGGEKIYFSGLGMLRLDMGGSSSQLPSDLGLNLGGEVGFGVVYQLTSRLNVEVRARAQFESFSWEPAAGGSTKSSMSTTFLILDAGLGYRF